MFIDNAKAGRFEWTEQGMVSWSDYYKRGETYVLPHVEAPAALRGSGAAGRLMQATADHARANGLKLQPVCSYAVLWFRRHPDQQDVLAA